MAKDASIMRFSANAWLADERLRLCSPAARGAWMDLLCLMYKGARRGYLQQANGKPYTNEQIAAVVGCSVGEAASLLRELITSGAASTTRAGVVFSRRMIRDEHVRTMRSKAGKKGGMNSASLLKQMLEQSDKQQLKQNPEVVVTESEANSDFGSIFDDLEGEHRDEQERREENREEQREERSPPPPPSKEEKKEETREEKKEPRARRPAEFDPLFVRFWDAYPHKVGKKPSWEVWRGLNVDEVLLSVILTALDQHKRSRLWLKDGGEYIPHPRTWLNQRRWEDELPAHHANGQAPRSKIDAAIDAVFGGNADG